MRSAGEAKKTRHRLREYRVGRRYKFAKLMANHFDYSSPHCSFPDSAPLLYWLDLGLANFVFVNWLCPLLQGKLTQSVITKPGTNLLKPSNVLPYLMCVKSRRGLVGRWRWREGRGWASSAIHRRHRPTLIHFLVWSIGMFFHIVLFFAMRWSKMWFLTEFKRKVL